jgi:argininosuccinate synthase
MAEKVVLAYSGGLDTSVAIHWLKKNYGVDSICLSIDVGNSKNFEEARQRALKNGAVKAIVINAQDTFVKYFCWPALQANALYEGQYPLATALTRPLMAKLLVDTALAEGATSVAHGCTGKGNDQVRFDVGVHALAPQLKVLAPAREWNMTRDETIDYAKKYNIAITLSKKKSYSIDECLWGRAIETGVLEDPWNEPPDDVYEWTKSPDKTPDKPTYVEIGFEKGIPVSLDGQTLDAVDMVNRMNEIAGENGVGRIDHIENRVVGIKSREVYEAPAAVLLIQAHKGLEAMTLSKDQLRFKERVAIDIADIIYNGFWFGAHNRDLSTYIQSTQRFVTGTVRMKLFKGSSIVVGRVAPKSLYNLSLATYDKGDKFDQSMAVGFIHLWGLPVATQAQVQMIGEKDDPMAIPAMPKQLTGKKAAKAMSVKGKKSSKK